MAILAIVLPIARADVRLTGRVVDENSAPVGGAHISLKHVDATEPALEALSDPTGEFAIQVKHAGEYRIHVERSGFFRLQDRAIRLNEGPNEISLMLSALREIRESIDVPASPTPIDLDRTSSEQSLTGAQLLEVPFPSTHNLRNALRVVPGVVQDPRGGLHVDGGTEEQVFYSLDGFNLNDPLTGRFDTRLSIEAVRSLEISTGRFSPEFGKGSAGALAIRTETGDDKLRYSATNFFPGIENRKGILIGDWTPRLNLSGPVRKGRAWFSDSFDTQYHKHVVEELPKGMDRTASWRFSNLLHTQTNITPSNILHVGFLINFWSAPRDWLSALDPPQSTVDRRSRQWFIYMKDQVYMKRGALLEFGYAANRTFGREIPQGRELYIFTPEGKQGNYFVDAVRKARRDQFLANLFLPAFRLAGTHRLKTGIDIDGLSYWQDVRRTGFENRRENGKPLRRVSFHGSGLLSRSNVEASSYVQDSWRVLSNLLLEMGIRQDWDRIVGNTNLSPRFSFAWAPRGSERTKISGGYAVIYDASNLRLFTRPLDQYSVTAYFGPDGNPEREPGASLFTINKNRRLASPRYRNFSLGIEQQLPGNLYARVDWRRRRGRHGFTYESIPFTNPGFDSIYELGNQRRDVFDLLGLTMRQAFRNQYEWMASFTRSQAFSNAVVDLNIDNPVLITNNVGRMPWDAPNRFLSWGYLPAPWRNWAVAYLLEWRNGFPFSIQDEGGRLLGQINSFRFPAFFELNLHLERRFVFRGHRWAWRLGANNATNRKNPTVVNNDTSSPHFLNFYGGQHRAFNFRIRWLGRVEKTR